MLTETVIDAKNADWTIPQNWERFTPAEHAVWDLLFARQQAALKGVAVADFFRGLDVLRLSHPGIPDLEPGLVEICAIFAPVKARMGVEDHQPAHQHHEHDKGVEPVPDPGRGPVARHDLGDVTLHRAFCIAGRDSLDSAPVRDDLPGRCAR